MGIKWQAALALLALAASASAQVKIDENPNDCSAGKSTASEIDKWFDANIKLEQFDIWAGKKDRLYLNGAWKFVRLAGMPPIEGADLKKSPFLLQDSDFGEKEGFFKPSFDDSKWFNQPVPLAWLSEFKPSSPPADLRSAPVLGWYRKSFEIPSSWKGRRVILNFNAATWRASVYLNGKLLGVNEESRKPGSVWIGGNCTREAFSFDVSDEVKFDAPNLLAVKVYSPAPNGGIWQEVYLEARPEIYLERALITPMPEKNSIKVYAFMENSTGKDVGLRWSVELGPWKSARYSLASGEVRTTKLQPVALKPGMNEVEFQVSVDAPQYWSPAKPWLYHFVLKSASGEVLGQERFGFRTFTVGKDNFLLNGKPILLRAKNTMPHSWDLPGNYPLIQGYGLLDKDGMIERAADVYMAAGFNLMRCHLGILPLHVFTDVADEKGLLLYPEEGVQLYRSEGVEKLENGEAVLTKAFKDAIRRRCEYQYNIPSIVMQSLHNECYDSYALMLPQWKATGFGPALRAIYDEYRKYDTTRPYVSSSGRGPTEGGFAPITLEKNKGDFDDGHLYNVIWNFKYAEDDSWSGSFKKAKALYTKDNGHERAMLDGECYFFYSEPKNHASGFPLRVKELKPHLDAKGQFDRKWMAENLKDDVNRFGLYDYSMIPFRVSADANESFRYSAWPLQQCIELMRRKRSDVAGYVLHSPVIFATFSEKSETYPFLFDAAKMAQQPVLACFDGLFNRDLIAGASAQAKLYLLNDTEAPLEKAVVSVSLSADGWKTVLSETPFETIPVGGMAVKNTELAPPASLPSGHCDIELDVVCGGKRISHNVYVTYVLSSADIKLSVKPSALALYSSSPDGGETGALLKSLGVDFRVVDSFAKLSASDKLALVPPGKIKEGTDVKPLLSWIDAGGKAVVLEQKAMLPGLLPGRTGVVGGGCYGWMSELVLLDHPVFKGLAQEDFRVWNGDGVKPETMKVAEDCLLPLSESSLAMIISTNSRMGSTLCEAKRGEGRVLFSEFDATRRFGKDSVATKYLLNVLDYALGSFDDPRATELDFKAAKAESFDVDPKKAFFVDIKGAANMGFVDEVAGDKKGGWSDQGPFNDARTMPLGKQVFAGVPFEIVDPATNDGKSCVVLRGEKGTGSEFLPLESKRIMVGKKARKLFFLVAGTWVPAYYMRKDDEVLAKFEVNMNIKAETGGMAARYPVNLIGGRNFENWWAPKNVPEALIGWRGLAGKSDSLKEVGAYVVEWSNPEPGVEIGWIDFSSCGRCLPILIAITGEE